MPLIVRGREPQEDLLEIRRARSLAARARWEEQEEAEGNLPVGFGGVGWPGRGLPV